MEVAEALSDARQLVTRISMGKRIRSATYEFKSVCVGVVLDVFWQVPIRHPIRYELKGSDSDAPDGQYGLVCQAFTHYGLLVEGL